MKNIDNMIVGDFLHLLDCMQEECCCYKTCNGCRYNEICECDISNMETIAMKDTVKSYAESNGLLEQMHYATSENEMKWIPVSEMLPNRHHRVLCYFKYEPESPDIISENTYICSGMWMSESDKVVAWMPLPEPYTPYKGEQKLDWSDFK